MKYEYQKTNRYFAQVSAGMEKLAADELNELGTKDVKTIHRGVYFDADKSTLYRVNYQTRIISRILAPLLKFNCHSTRYLYSKGREISWEKFFTVNNTFAIFANVSNSKITHSQYAALRLKDAIADYFRELQGKRPSVERIEPDVWINLHIENDFATISWDTSCGALHRRGYRKETVEAPMQETVAAAIIRMSEWNGEQPLYNPFCGSGTILAEALMHYCRIPAGLLRRQFGFEYLPDFDASEWRKVKMNSNAAIRKPKKGFILGSDISAQAIKAAEHNLAHIIPENSVELKVQDFREICSIENSCIVCNPPHGIRMSNKRKVSALYKHFGDFLKQRCQGSTAFVYFGDRSLISKIGLRPGWKKPLRNGGQDGRLCKFEIY